MKQKLYINQILKQKDNYKLKLINIINCNQDIINYKINIINQKIEVKLFKKKYNMKQKLFIKLILKQRDY